MHLRTLFPYPGNGWTDSAEIWCVVLAATAIPTFYRCYEWSKLHVCTTFDIPVAGYFLLKFGVFMTRIYYALYTGSGISTLGH